MELLRPKCYEVDKFDADTTRRTLQCIRLSVVQ